MMLSALLDHLWQSTLLALGIGLVVLALRKAPASARHGLWFAASIKFLLPFAAFASLGRVLAARLPAVPVAATPQAGLIEKAAEPLSRFPFAQTSALSQAPLSPAEAGPAVVHAAAHAALHADPALIVLLVWALGCAAVLVRWTIRWGRVRQVLRSAAPLDWPAPMPVLASPTLMEPGLVGFLRPVLVIPQTLPDHLIRSEVDAIVAHEACHLRRGDNLTAAIHTLVEAIFWFHPLVWWIGARLIAERERACDEAVVRAGHDRATYARSLVQSARLYLQSPLSCVAGASGSDLKTRVEMIMTAPAASPLSRAMKALLLAGAAFAFATPVAAGLLASESGAPSTPLAATVAAVSTPARAFAGPPAAPAAPDASAAPPMDESVKPIALTHAKAAVAPALRVASINAAPVSLARTVAAPPLDAAQATAPAAPAASVAQTAEPLDPKQSAYDFVQSYAAVTPQRQLIARWTVPLCIRVAGLSPDQDAAVKARVAEVARAAGVAVAAAGCVAENVEIGFTPDPQGALDQVIAHKGRLLGDKTSGTSAVKAVSLPVQAWYLTNGVEFAAYDAGDAHGLRILIDDQLIPYSSAPGAGIGPGGVMTYQGSGGASGPAGACCVNYSPSWGAASRDSRELLNVLVIVDLRRTGVERLAPIADYVAMLALSQPSSPGRCQTLPSITDLFAGACPGRAAPTGLTSADALYLAALYSAGPRFGSAKRADVVERMAAQLANTRMASR